MLMKHLVRPTSDAFGTAKLHLCVQTDEMRGRAGSVVSYASPENDFAYEVQSLRSIGEYSLFSQRRREAKNIAQDAIQSMAFR